MGEKDITEKLLEDYPDVFADIFNVLVFDGEKLIKEDELSESIVHSQYKAEDGRVHELERDVAKKWIKNNVALSLFGVENQTAVEKFMPLRVMGYDGASYRSQLLNLESEKRKLYNLKKECKITEEEYSIRMKKVYDSICPVITIVLYFGTEYHWNESDTLKKVLDVPEKLEAFVNDYKIHIFEIAWLSEEQINLMTSDFKIIARFFRDKRLGVDDIMRDTTQIKHIDEVLKLFSAMTGDSRYVEVMEMAEYKEVDTMCEMFDRAVNKGIEAGIKQASAIIKEKEEQILEQANQLSQKEEQIKDKEEQIKDKEEQIKDKEEQIKDKEEQITEQEFIIEELKKQLAIYQKQ